MIVSGFRSGAVHLGQVESRYCTLCQQAVAFHLTLLYSYFHLYWLFGVVTEKKYWLLCPACNWGPTVAPNDLEPHSREPNGVELLAVWNSTDSSARSGMQCGGCTGSVVPGSIEECL